MLEVMMKSQTIHQIDRGIFQKASLWLALVVLCTAVLLPACSPSMPQAFEPSTTIENPVNDTENNPKSTPQPTSTKPCLPQESTEETAPTVSVPRTPSSTEGSASNPDLIDLTEREFPDESANTPESDCGTVTPTPAPPTESETPSQ
jgi:hypothetical protein